MSIRRIVQLIVFVSALAISFSAPIASSSALACDPQGSSGYC